MSRRLLLGIGCALVSLAGSSTAHARGTSAEAPTVTPLSDVAVRASLQFNYADCAGADPCSWRAYARVEDASGDACTDTNPFYTAPWYSESISGDGTLPAPNITIAFPPTPGPRRLCLYVQNEQTQDLRAVGVAKFTPIATEALIPRALPVAPRRAQVLTSSPVKLAWTPGFDDAFTQQIELSRRPGLKLAHGAFLDPLKTINLNATPNTAYLLRGLPQGRYFWHVLQGRVPATSGVPGQSYWGWGPTSSFDVLEPLAPDDARTAVRRVVLDHFADSGRVHRVSCVRSNAMQSRCVMTAAVGKDSLTVRGRIFRRGTISDTTDHYDLRAAVLDQYCLNVIGYSRSHCTTTRRLRG